MHSYLVSWNPRRSAWINRKRIARDIKEKEYGTTSWPVISKHVWPGDRIFFIRLGKEPRGIFATGSAVSHPYISPHWDEVKKKQGKTIRIADIRLDAMIEMDTEPLLDISELHRAPLDRMHWSTQCSGIHIPAHVVQALDELWEQHIQQVKNARTG